MAIFHSVSLSNQIQPKDGPLLLWLLHASSAPSSFPLWAWSKAKPAALAAPGIVVTFMGGVTLTSMAASLPPVQLGTRTSAGRRSLPGRRKRPSLTGPGLLQLLFRKLHPLGRCADLCVLHQSQSRVRGLQEHHSPAGMQGRGHENWQPKAILHHKHKLDRAEVKP